VRRATRRRQLAAGRPRRVFFGTGMLHYQLYPAYFRVWALGRYRAATAARATDQVRA